MITTVFCNNILQPSLGIFLRVQKDLNKPYRYQQIVSYRMLGLEYPNQLAIVAVLSVNICVNQQLSFCSHHRCNTQHDWLAVNSNTYSYLYEIAQIQLSNFLNSSMGYQLFSSVIIMLMELLYGFYQVINRQWFFKDSFCTRRQHLR